MKNLKEKFYQEWHSEIGGSTCEEVFTWFEPMLKKAQDYKKAIKIIKENYPNDCLSDQLNEDIIKWDKLTKGI